MTQRFAKRYCGLRLKGFRKPFDKLRTSELAQPVSPVLVTKAIIRGSV